MNELVNAAADAENKLKDIHFSNKCTDPVFHEYLAGLYEFAFSVRHRLAERMADLDAPVIGAKSKQEFRKEAYDIIEWLKVQIEEFIWKDKPTIWTDNLLRGIADEMEWHLGNTKPYLNNIG